MDHHAEFETAAATAARHEKYASAWEAWSRHDMFLRTAKRNPSNTAEEIAAWEKEAERLGREADRLLYERDNPINWRVRSERLAYRR